MRKDLILFIAILILGAVLRLVGLTRGISDVVPQSATSAFYTFHPDEETLLGAALQFDSLLQPPLTAYGVFPMLVARATLGLSSFFYEGELTLEHAAARPTIFVVARLLSVLFSLGTLALVYWLGRHFFNPRVAALATALVACAPLAIQQAHFYTVDGVFVPLMLAALAAMLLALENRQRRWYIIAGFLIGLAAATRLNGALLGLVLLAAYMLKDRPQGAGAAFIIARLKRPELWIAGLLALATLFVLQPYLLSDFTLMQRAQNSDDFAYSLQIARGEVLRPWTLIDVHTLPYLHYWTHLWPQAVGWPLALLLVVGMGYALWSWRWVQLLLLAWCAVYFSTIGGLHTKHVRYLLPMLPCLALLAAAFLDELARRWRWPTTLLISVVIVYTAAYGTAFARIYSIEDSRLQAARWLYANVPIGSRIAVENGGFSLGEFIDDAEYRKRNIVSGMLFGTRGYLLCESGRQYLYSRVEDTDYIAVTDVNRYVQYTAVPEMYPVLAGFYKKLFAGELGFEPVQRFKVHAEWGGWRFVGENAEPSFYGYDHPAVWILKRTSSFAEDWERWRQELRNDDHCADALLQQTATALRDDRVSEAAISVHQARQRYEDFLLMALIEAEILQQQGDEEGAAQSLRAYAQGYVMPVLMAQYIPWAAAASLLLLDLPDLAHAALADGVTKGAYMRPWQKRQLADSYASIAVLSIRSGHDELAAETYRFAALADPRAEFCNALAQLAIQGQRREEALSWWQTSLELDETQVDILRLAGKTAYQLSAYDQALLYLGRAVELDAQLSVEQKISDYNALAQEAQITGTAKRALWLWRHSLALNPDQPPVRQRVWALEQEELRD